MISDQAWDIIQKIAAGMGTGGVLFCLLVLYFVNKERVAANERAMTLVVEGIKSNNRVANALEAIERKLSGRRRRSRGSR
jgi:hypothetical protein